MSAFCFVCPRVNINKRYAMVAESITKTFRNLFHGKYDQTSKQFRTGYPEDKLNHLASYTKVGLKSSAVSCGECSGHIGLPSLTNCIEEVSKSRLVTAGMPYHSTPSYWNGISFKMNRSWVSRWSPRLLLYALCTKAVEKARSRLRWMRKKDMRDVMT